MISNKEPLSGVVAISNFDFIRPDLNLRPEINRPDIYEEKITYRPPHENITDKKESVKNIILTTSIIIISAFIFIFVVAWFGVLQSYLDYLIINPIIESQVKSRLFYAGLVTLITLLIFMIFFLIYPKLKPSHS